MAIKKRNTFANKMHTISQNGYIRELKDLENIKEFNDIYLDWGSSYANEAKNEFMEKVESGLSLFVYYNFLGENVTWQYNTKGLEGFKSFVEIVYLDQTAVYCPEDWE